mgnify:CR=1 FL=1
MVKLLENTFRSVNIGLVNELALMCDRLEDRRVGSDRGGGDQAIRLHAVLSRPRPRRTLHPDRSVLPVVEGARERLRGPLHRARGLRQRADARARRQPRGGGPQPPRSRGARLARCSCWASPTRRRSTTRARVPRSTSWRSCASLRREDGLQRSLRAHAPVRRPQAPERQADGRRPRALRLRRRRHRAQASSRTSMVLRHARAIVDTRNAFKGKKSAKITRL